jgi:hypothetical protein
MTAPTSVPADWPALPPLQEWVATCTTVHMWTQIVGKIRLALTPRINHWWGVTLLTSPRGLATPPIPYASRSFAIELDFLEQRLRIATSDGTERSFGLQPMSVAAFFRKMMTALDELGIAVKIFARPVEVPEAIPFEADEKHASYEAEPVQRFWRALVQVDRVLTVFRARFIGKASPVHFFWGGFDLAVTRFSGQPAPRHSGGIPNCADWVMHEAYSHEVSSAGFWPGAGVGEASFYSYAYPMPPGFATYGIEPRAAYFHQPLGEFLLPYEAVRTADDPDATLLSFLQTTYEAAAVSAHWDRRALER